MARQAPKMKIVGIGGSGCNTVFRMQRIRARDRKSSLWDLTLVAVNTDLQDLKKGKADEKLWIGKEESRGMGTGMNPDLGRSAAREQAREIEKLLKGQDAVFLAGGEGGGTFTGAAPEIASMAQKMGVLTVGAATFPFEFEGVQRKEAARRGLADLGAHVDSLLTVYNDKLLPSLPHPVPLQRAFEACDAILHNAVRGMFDALLKPSVLEVNFSDIRSLLSDSGSAMFGMGEGEGEERSLIAAQKALQSPLLEADPRKARGILLTVSGNGNVSLDEVQKIASFVKERTGGRARMVFGATDDARLGRGLLRVTLVLTGV